MSVLIKDMEKPEFCYVIIDGKFEYCPFVNTDDDCILLLKKGICERTWQGQYSKCPFIEAPEPCEDAVSRQGAIDAIGEVHPLDYNAQAIKSRIEKLPPVQPKTCDDAVSRKDAIRWVKTECNPYGKPTLDFESGKKVIDHLMCMSSVTPKPEPYREEGEQDG